MSDKNKLLALYNYVKLVKPDEDILLRHDLTISGSGADGRAAFFRIFCTNGNFVGYTYGYKFFCPSWLHDVFHVCRVPFDKVKNRLPEYEQKQATTRLCRRFYVLEPKEEGLFSND